MKPKVRTKPLGWVVAWRPDVFCPWRGLWSTVYDKGREAWKDVAERRQEDPYGDWKVLPVYPPQRKASDECPSCAAMRRQRDVLQAILDGIETVDDASVARARIMGAHIGLKASAETIESIAKLRARANKDK